MTRSPDAHPRANLWTHLFAVFLVVAALAAVPAAASASLARCAENSQARQCSLDFTATSGQQFTTQIATFVFLQDGNVDDFGVSWGDGTPTQQFNPVQTGASTYSFFGTHVFAAPGTYTVTTHVTVTGETVTTVGTAVVKAPAPQVINAPTQSAPAWNPGEVVTADHGNWSNNPGSYTYRWQRCAATCTNIPGADAADNDTTYTLTGDDNGKRVRVIVTARNAGGAGSKATSQSPVIGIPINTAPPTINGRSQAGNQLTADPGAWIPAGDYTYRWRRCGTACEWITSTDADDGDSTYTLTAADVGARIRVRVTANNTAGTGKTADSPATNRITAAPAA